MVGMGVESSPAMGEDPPFCDSIGVINKGHFSFQIIWLKCKDSKFFRRMQVDERYLENRKSDMSVGDS